MECSGVRADWRSFHCDALIYPQFSDSSELEDGPFAHFLSRVRESGEWKAEVGEVLVLHDPVGAEADRMILLGLGKREELDPGRTRLSVMKALRLLKGSRLGRLGIVAAVLPDEARFVQMAAEGVLMSTFEPAPYRSNSTGTPRVEEIVFLLSEHADLRRFESCYEKAQVIGEAVNLARGLTNEPGNLLTPAGFAERAREIGGQEGFSVEVFDEAWLRQEGLEAILSVAAGSRHAPHLLLLKHEGGKPEEHPAVLVGKGVTFDSGGLSLKPSPSMEEMKSDKAGAAAVLGAFQAIARLEARRTVIGVIPLVENMPGGNAQRPGDVIRCFGGKTVEVVNTDAEGRLILADAMAWVLSRWKPDFLVDIATLTGACVVALGYVRAAYFSNNERLVRKFRSAVDRSAEKFWRLPLDVEYGEDLRSSIADLKNCGERWGGAVSAAKFLEAFVGDTPWCHIDMAGVDLFRGEQKADGPRGFGVRTMAELVIGD